MITCVEYPLTMPNKITASFLILCSYLISIAILQEHKGPVTAVYLLFAFVYIVYWLNVVLEEEPDGTVSGLSEMEYLAQVIEKQDDVLFSEDPTEFPYDQQSEITFVLNDDLYEFVKANAIENNFSPSGYVYSIVFACAKMEGFLVSENWEPMHGDPNSDISDVGDPYRICLNVPSKLKCYLSFKALQNSQPETEWIIQLIRDTKQLLEVREN